MNKTVYIIGAGASQEVGLPIGDQLKETISRILNIRFRRGGLITGDSLLTEALQKLARESDRPEEIMRSYVNAAQQISRAMPLAISIDNYIDSHPGDDEIALCGKLAIVRSILGAEQDSRLAFYTSGPGSSIDLNSLDKTWYMPFFRLLTENCSYGGTLKERLRSIVFIVFNYDRCIEHFIYHALQIYYNIPRAVASELISCMNIYHPYGSVGSLPWYANGDSMGFGAEPNQVQLLQLVGKIKTFTEGTDPKFSEISEIRNHIDTAHKMVFLGFAFHELNMKLITPDPDPDPDKVSSQISRECYATTFDFSESKTNAIKRQINSLYSGPYVGPMEAEMADLTCAAFFKEFSRSLSF